MRAPGGGWLLHASSEQANGCVASLAFDAGAQGLTMGQEEWSEEVEEDLDGMRRVALIVGAGDATGGALARRFAREGMVVAIARRARHTEKLQELAASINASGGAAHAMPVDARVESDVVDLVRRCEELGELELVVHNIGANVRFAAHETTERVFRKVWELACPSAFLVGREGSKPMAQRGRGTLIFTGATASVRGASHFSAFSAGMAGKRALSQSLASELGPKGVHVAHVVVDGAELRHDLIGRH